MHTHIAVGMPITGLEKRDTREIIMRILMIGFLIVVLVACKPTPTHFEMPVTNIPIYDKAWREGCESGFSAYGNDVWRAFYHYNSDIKLMNTNKIYSRVWWDSFNYCRHYVNRYLMDGYWGGEGFGDGKAENFNEDLRNTKIINVKGFSFPWWEGADTPGWGEHSWGAAQEAEHDWLWRDSKKTDWLGRTKENQ